MPKILLIDDDVDFVKATQLALESDGYTVDAAHSGDEGLVKVMETVPDLIVLDVMMPGTDGWETCRRLKESDQTGNIPVIMLTAVASNLRTTGFTHEDGMMTEAEEYLAKPVDTGELLKKIHFLLDK